MSFLEYRVKFAPTGIRKILYLNWPLVLLVTAVASVGFLMLYSIAGGNIETWAQPQMERFGVGMVLMFMVALTPIWFWRSMSGLAYIVAFLLLIVVEFFGTVGMGAQRWIDLGFIQVQPSEMMKFTLVMVLAAYYDWLDIRKVSHPLWVGIAVMIIVVPSFLVLKQPDLGTALLVLAGGAFVLFMGGLRWRWILSVLAATVPVAVAMWIFVMHDYQKQRVLTFLDPESDPLGTGWNIIQSKAAIGSGGVFGKGWLLGTQSHLDFLPESHTDFIIAVLGEEFGLVGICLLLVVYLLLVVRGLVITAQAQTLFGKLLAGSLTMTFFVYVFINIGMVSGLLPVVGVPLPFISYGGTSMVTLMTGFGILMSIHTHRKWIAQV